jgi:hypothetical protein
MPVWSPSRSKERLPLVIGGSGERRTLRIRHLLDVLARHCADVGRDPADVRKSLTFRVILDGDERGAQERRERRSSAGSASVTSRPASRSR